MFDDVFAGVMERYPVHFLIVLGVLIIIGYFYSCLTLMLAARKLGFHDDVMAWIPIANLVLMSRMAKMHWWPVLFAAAGGIVGIGGIIAEVDGWVFLLAIVPLMVLLMLPFAVFYYIWWWRITELRGLDGWMVLFSLVPYVGGVWSLVLWGMLAWREGPASPPDQLP